jgi:hypothetical protein
VVSKELEVRVLEFRPERAEGSATRFGFALGWVATWDGAEWLVEIPPGHSLGPDGKGAFEIVTDDDWKRFTAAVRREIDGRRQRKVAG